MSDIKKANLIDSIFSLISVVLAFMMPVFFLPTTTEFFEFNKLTLLSVSTFILVAFWATSMILKKKVFITKSILDLGLLALFASVVLSSIFSLHKVSSIFGSYGRWFPSLFSFSVILAYYYVLVSNTLNVKTVKLTVGAFLAGSTISTIVALLSYYGIKISSSPYFQAPNFSLTGSTVSASMLAALVVVIALSLFIKTKSPISKILILQLLLVNLVGTLILGNLPVFAALVFGVVSVFYFGRVEDLKFNKPYFLVLAGIISALLVVLVVPTTRNVILNKNYPREIFLPARESRIVALSVLRDYPLLGAGPSTFYLNFPIYRSISMNVSDYWNVRFDKPYGEVFNVISSLGIVGVIAVLLLVSRVAKVILHAKSANTEEMSLISTLSAGLIAMLVYFTLTYASVLTTFVFFTFMALVVALWAMSEDKKYAQNVTLSLSSLGTNNSSMSILGDAVEKSEILPYIVAVPLVGAVLFGFYHTYRIYMGEYYMRQAVMGSVNNNATQVLQMQAKAINMVAKGGQRDTYHNSYAQTNIILANNLASKKELTEDEKQAINALIAQSIGSARVTTESLNPINVANWETRAFIYRSLLGAAQDADQWAIGAYTNAIQLDPTNPRLRLDLGGLYYAKGDYLNAANLFRQAISLKSDYANARYNFAHSLVQLKAYPDAQREFELILKLVPQDSPDYKKASEDLENVKNLIAQSGTSADSKPTVEQIEASKGIEEGQTSENQEPLIKAGEEEATQAPANTPRQ